MDLPPGVLSRKHFEHKKKNTTQSRRGASVTQTKQNYTLALTESSDELRSSSSTGPYKLWQLHVMA